MEIVRLLNKPACGYFRLSTKEQATEGAVKNHETAIDLALQQINLYLVSIGDQPRTIPPELLISENESGTNNKRPGLQRLLQLIRDEEISCLIVRLDRLTRDVSMSAEVGRLLDKSPVRLWDILKRRFVDFANPEDWGEFHTAGVANARESRVISMRVRTRLEVDRRLGLPHAGKTPRGIQRRSSGGYEIKPGCENLVRRIAEVYIETTSSLETARIIKDEFGVSFSTNGLTQWLANEVLRGHTPHLRNNRKRTKPGSATHVIRNTHEPLLDPGTIAKIDRILVHNRKSRGRGKKKIHPIAGLLTCAQCNGEAKLCGASRKGGVAYVYCTAYTKGFKDHICGSERLINRENRRGRQRSVGFTETEVEQAVIRSLQSRATALVDSSLEEISRSASAPTLSSEDRETMAEIARLEQLCSEMPHLASHFRGAIVDLRSKLQPVPTQENNLEEQRQLLIEVMADAELWEEITPYGRKEIFQSFVKAIVLDRRNRTIDVQLWV